MSAKILRDRTGASKQAGFVQMSSKEGAQAAVSYLTGREVRAKSAICVALCTCTYLHSCARN